MRRPHRLLLIACATVLVLAVGGLSAFALAGRSPRTVAVRLSGTGTHVVPVALVDTPRGFAVQPNRITVDPGTPLVLDVVNQADEHHDLAVDGGTTRTRMLDPGQSRRLDLGRLAPISAQLYRPCGQVKSKRSRRPAHQGTVVAAGRSALRRTGE